MDENIIDKILFDHGVNTHLPGPKINEEDRGYYQKYHDIYDALKRAQIQSTDIEDKENAYLFLDKYANVHNDEEDGDMARNTDRYKISSDELDIDETVKTFSITVPKLTKLLNGNFYWPWESTLIGKALGDQYPMIEITSTQSGSHATMTLIAIDSSKYTFRPTVGTIAKRHPQLKGWVLEVLR